MLLLVLPSKSKIVCHYCQIFIGKSRENTTSTKNVLSIKLDAAVTVPVVLKDVQPPRDPKMKPLNEVISSISGGPTTGKFYKGDSAPALITTLRVEGSCARIALEDDASDTQKSDLERFRSRLQAGQLVGYRLFTSG